MYTNFCILFSVFCIMYSVFCILYLYCLRWVCMHEFFAAVLARLGHREGWRESPTPPPTPHCSLQLWRYSFEYLEYYEGAGRNKFTLPPHHPWMKEVLDNTLREGGLPTLPGLNLSTIQPSRRGFFRVHTSMWRKRKPEPKFSNFSGPQASIPQKW